MGIMVKRNAGVADKVEKVANMAGVTTRYVYKVLRGERKNEDVFSAYMLLAEGENELVEHVKKTIPFDKPRPKPTFNKVKQAVTI